MNNNLHKVMNINDYRYNLTKIEKILDDTRKELDNLDEDNLSHQLLTDYINYLSNETLKRIESKEELLDLKTNLIIANEKADKYTLGLAATSLAAIGTSIFVKDPVTTSLLLGEVGGMIYCAVRYSKACNEKNEIADEYIIRDKMNDGYRYKEYSEFVRTRK